MTRRIALMTLATAATLLAPIGCEAPPQFDPASGDTAETLAADFLNSYRSLRHPEDPGALPESRSASDQAAAKRDAGKAAAKAKEIPDLDALLDRTIAQAATIAGTTRSAACRKVAEVVAKDRAVAESDRKTIADRLNAVRDAEK